MGDIGNWEQDELKRICGFWERETELRLEDEEI